MDDWESLVEATINAVRVDTAKKEVRIEVTCAWEGKERKLVVATGVDDFVVNEMRISNVIDQAIRFDADNIKDEYAEVAQRLFFLMRGKEPSASDLEWPAMQDKLARIQDGTLCMLEIEPVYGATILVLAENIVLEHIR